jgi:hypothetical protein
MSRGKRSPFSGVRRKSQRRLFLGVEKLEDRSLLALLGQELFPADNAWNQNIASAPVASNSAAIINNILTNYGDGRLHPDFGQDSNTSGDLYGIPYNVVHGNSTAKTTVVIDAYADESDLTPVPIPTNVVIEGDFQNGPKVGVDNRGDSHLIIFDVDNNVAYEFYRASRPSENADGKWHADQETVWDMKTNTQRTIGYTSVDAAGLSVLAGLVRPDEGLPVSQGGQGVIDHAIRFTLQNSVILDQFIYPASHTANPGNTNATILPPMGVRFRLKSNVDISQLNPQAKIIAQAMKDYGMIVADNGSNFFFSGASASVNASNQQWLTWDDNDIQDSTHGLKSLHFSNFEVVDLTPQVTDLSVHTGSAGTSVTVIGQNFSGAAGHLQVLFGNTPATSITIVDDSHVLATAPAGSGTIDVRVQSGITTPANPDNIKNTIFGYGISATLAADRFTYGGATSGAAAGNVTSAKANGAYTAGTTVDVTVDFSAAVTVTGTPQLQLETGTVDRFAAYVSGSGTSTLTFRYTVQAGDSSSDLDYVGTGALGLNGGTIKDAGGVDATLTLATPGLSGSLGANKNLVIDTTASTISGVATSNLTATGVSIAWMTNEATSTQVEYGTTTAYGSSSALNSALVNSHSVALTGLTAGTAYHYRVRSRDAAGNLSVSGDFTFTTPVLSTGLVAAYSFNEGSGTTVRDVSGNNNLGTIQGATWVAGKYNNALSFNGTSSRVDIVDSATLHLTTGMTLEAWVKPATSGNTWQNVVYKGNDNYYLMAKSPTAGRPAGGGTIGGVKNTVSGTSVLPVGVWSHLAATYDGASLRLYVNGVQVASVAKTGNIKTSGNLLQIGGNTIFGQYFKGVIDEVKVYNRALSKAQIQADMNAAGDITSPALSGITPSNVTASSATISWTSSEAADTQVDYGKTTAYGSKSPLVSTLSTSHSVNLTGLTANTTYHYRVRSRDANGNLNVSGDFAFTTLASLVASAPFHGTASPNPATITEIQPLLAAALTRWQIAGANISALGQVELRLEDLPGNMLGQAAGRTITLHPNAAGWGWFVDQTPANDSEFTTPGDQGEQEHMDVLTVLLHELGHLLGLEHDKQGVMASSLSAGTRQGPI